MKTCGSAGIASYFSHFSLGKQTSVPISLETGWAPELIWTQWWRKNIPAPARN